MFLLGNANWWTPRWLTRIPSLLQHHDARLNLAVATVQAEATSWCGYFTAMTSTVRMSGALASRSGAT